MNSFKTSGYEPRLTDGKSEPTRELTKHSSDTKTKINRASVIFVRYLLLSVLFILVGAAFAYPLLTRNTEVCQKFIVSHFQTDGVSKILFVAKVFCARALPVILICLGSLTFFSGGISTVILSLSAAVFGVGTCAVLSLRSQLAAAYIIWSALLCILYVSASVFARKFFVFLFVERKGYSNVRGLAVYLALALLFLLLLLIISVIYTFVVYGL